MGTQNYHACEVPLHYYPTLHQGMIGKGTPRVGKGTSRVGKGTPRVR